jgi:hypothetical protein
VSLRDAKFDEPGNTLTPQERVFWDIIQERKYQDGKWGGALHDDEEMDEDDWLVVIEELIDDTRDYREALVKIAATAVAAIESYDRKAKSGVE